MITNNNIKNIISLKSAYYLVRKDTNKERENKYKIITMLAKEDEVEVEVRKVDQEAINEFGRLNNRVSELRDELKLIEKELTAYEDAEEEVMLIEGETEALKLTMGDCFLDVEEEDIESELERLKEIAEKKKDGYAEEVTKCEARQAELKAQLYGRVGKTINLEE